MYYLKELLSDLADLFLHSLTARTDALVRMRTELALRRAAGASGGVQPVMDSNQLLNGVKKYH